MRYKRELFFIKKNFKFKFILFFVIILVVCIAAATISIYHLASMAFEKAAFSSHLSLASSAQLVSQAILGVNVRMGLFCIVAGVIGMIFMHFYIENFFHALVKRLRELENGKFSSRLGKKRFLLGRSVAKQYNVMVDRMNHNSLRIKGMSRKCLRALDDKASISVEEIKSLTDELSQIDCP